MDYIENLIDDDIINLKIEIPYNENYLDKIKKVSLKNSVKIKYKIVFDLYNYDKKLLLEVTKMKNIEKYLKELSIHEINEAYKKSNIIAKYKKGRIKLEVEKC